MVIIDQGKCTGCGLCVADCFPQHLRICEGKAKAREGRCMQCGHCIAVCPQAAVSLEDYDMEEVTEIAAPPVTADELLGFIRSRRSVRQFQDRKVERELLIQAIEAGRYTPTGGNAQGLSYIVVEKEMSTFKKLVTESLEQKGRAMLEMQDLSPVLKGYAQRWIFMADSYRQNPNKGDFLFFNAPAVILIAGESTLDAGLAASNMELMLCAQGLGMLYSGFIAKGCSGNEEIRALLHLDGQTEIQACLVVGYPNVQYLRTVPRKKADVSWL